MRISLRLLPALTILSLVTGFGLLDVANNTGGDISPYVLPSLLVIVLAFLCGFVTFILGIVAMAMHRQFGWLVALLAAGLIPLGGAIAISIVAPMLTPEQQTPPEGCKPPPGTPVPPGCQGPPPSPSGLVTFLNTVDPILFIGTPILVALVVFVYSFRMRDVTAPVALRRF